MCNRLLEETAKTNMSRHSTLVPQLLLKHCLSRPPDRGDPFAIPHASLPSPRICFPTGHEMPLEPAPCAHNDLP